MDLKEVSTSLSDISSCIEEGEEAVVRKKEREEKEKISLGNPTAQRF